MKRYIILGALLASAAFAQAELGDNYATLCKERGRQGVATATGQWVYWSPANEQGAEVWAQFRNNRCEALLWSFRDNLAFPEGEIWRTLVMNSHAARWHEYSTDLTDTRCFASDDGLMVAWLSKGIALHLAYKTWVDRHHMWADRDDYQGTPLDKKPSGDDALPPVQEKSSI
jgi:hypothetical protein